VDFFYKKNEFELFYNNNKKEKKTTLIFRQAVEGLKSLSTLNFVTSKIKLLLHQTQNHKLPSGSQEKGKGTKKTKKNWRDITLLVLDMYPNEDKVTIMFREVMSLQKLILPARSTLDV
jgi:hypothetical protein